MVAKIYGNKIKWKKDNWNQKWTNAKITGSKHKWKQNCPCGLENMWLLARLQWVLVSLLGLYWVLEILSVSSRENDSLVLDRIWNWKIYFIFRVLFQQNQYIVGSYIAWYLFAGLSCSMVEVRTKLLIVSTVDIWPTIGLGYH